MSGVGAPSATQDSNALEKSLVIALGTSAAVYAISRLACRPDSRIPFLGALISAGLGMFVAVITSKNLNSAVFTVYGLFILWLVSFASYAVRRFENPAGNKISTRLADIKHGEEAGASNLASWVSETTVVFLLCLPIWYLLTTKYFDCSLSLMKFEAVAAVLICSLIFYIHPPGSASSKSVKYSESRQIFNSSILGNAFSTPALTKLWIVVQSLGVVPIFKSRDYPLSPSESALIIASFAPTVLLLLLHSGLNINIPCLFAAGTRKTTLKGKKKQPARAKMTGQKKPLKQKATGSATKPKIVSSKQAFSTPIEKRKPQVRKSSATSSNTASGPANSIKLNPRRRSTVSSYA